LPKVAQSYLAFLAQSYLAKLAHSILAVTIVFITGAKTWFLSEKTFRESLLTPIVAIFNDADEVLVKTEKLQQFMD